MTEISILILIGALLLFQRLRAKDTVAFSRWIKSLRSIWQVEFEIFTLAEKVTLAIVVIIAIFVYYDLVFYPITENDSIIYHASMAAIAFYNHGLPLIVGGVWDSGQVQIIPYYFHTLEPITM